MKSAATGIVYRNPLPHVHSRHAYFPSLIVRPDRELIVTMDIGEAFEAANIRSAVCRSSDGGATWSAPVRIFEPDETAHPVSMSARVAGMADGSLVAWACLLDRSDADCGLVSPTTDGIVPMEFAVLRSTDAGRSWSLPKKVKLPTPWRELETCSPVVEITPTRWLVPTSPVKNFAGERSKLPAGLALSSDDAGESWDGYVTTFGDTPDGLSVLEQKLTRLSDGRWLSVCWSIDRNGKTVPNRYAIGDAEARTFGAWTSTGIAGETCTPLALEDGRVLCVYRGFEKPGLWAQLARIDGEQWTPVADVCLWDGSAAPRGHPAERFSELRQMKDLRFGYPSLGRLPGGDVFVVFWCVENCVGNIRWIRVALQP